jgi:hypothetical protein
MHFLNVIKNISFMNRLRSNILETLSDRLDQQCQGGQSLLPIDEKVHCLLRLTAIAVRLLGRRCFVSLLYDNHSEIVLFSGGSVERSVHRSLHSGSFHE